MYLITYTLISVLKVTGKNPDAIDFNSNNPTNFNVV